jgi:hypothetical protein
MPDPAHVETDEILAELEAEIYEIYRLAAAEAQQTAREYLAWFTETDGNMRQIYEAGQITQQEFINWRISHLLTGSHFSILAQNLADDMINAQEIATSVINGYLPEVYAINHNYATYMIEHGLSINTSYELYDAQTVERLIRDKPDLIPIEALVKIPESERWNITQVSSIMTQSILQGDDIPTIATRISDNLPTRNRNAAIRDARTMTTSAENGGREDAYKRAESMGIEGEERWVATLDGRTRHAHRVLDGQKKPIGGKFHVDGYDIEFPGDPKAPPYLVYNCRCTTIIEDDDMELPDNFVGAFGYSKDDTLGNMSYEDWKADKGDSPFSKKARNKNKDYEQYYKYREILGKKTLPNFKDFQKMKYEDPASWEKLKKDVAAKRREKTKRIKK